MGICDSVSKPNKFINSPPIYHRQLEQIPPNYAYKFDFSNIKNKFNKTYNLKFTFSDFKVKYCVSHKHDKNSLYLIEIKIGNKEFPIIPSSGQSPNIPNPQGLEYSIEKEFKFEELENTYFFIDICEVTDQIPNLNMSMKAIPSQFKSTAKYNSFFRINLSSFLFKSSKCDFPLMGIQQLSTKSRIYFNCHIEQKEKIQIDARSVNNPNIHRLVFEYKDQILTSSTKTPNNLFSITTPPLTMIELQNADIFLETIEDDNYNYISLNSLKYNIISNSCRKISTISNMNKIELNSPMDMDQSVLNKSLNIWDKTPGHNLGSNNMDNSNNIFLRNMSKTEEQIVFENNEFAQNKNAILYLSNLPIFSQLNHLYFTEYGNIYNTAILNIINNDIDLHNFRKGKQISSDDFIEKLNKYYQEFCQPNYNYNITRDMQILLLRSIDNDKFMFIYPTYESLYSMVNLMMNLGIRLINNILLSIDEYQTMTFLKLINILMKREELDNNVLLYCFENMNTQNNDNLIQLYNQLYLLLFELYKHLLFTNKIPEDNDEPLLELFSRLYFKKKYLRKVMLSTLSRGNYEFQEYNCDALLYDEINDQKLNKYLNTRTIETIEDFCGRKDYMDKIQFDIYKLFKRIVCILKDSNIWLFPLDYNLFYDNDFIIRIIEYEIDTHKYENNNIINKRQLTNEFYETLMLFSNSYGAITRINNCLIQSTNAHNQFAVYTLYVYFKSLFDYHYSLTHLNPIFDYSFFEKAAEILVADEDSVSLPRLFWFYYSCHHLILSGNLKWFIINVVNKNFNRFAFHWSFTIRQVYFKLIIFVLVDKIKDKEGKLFNQSNIEPFLNGRLDKRQNPYIEQAIKDFEVIKKDFGVWVDKRRNDPSAEFPAYVLPLPVAINGGID